MLHLIGKPSSQTEAKLRGETNYFTGKPCKRGHISLRGLSGNCNECAKERETSKWLNDPERMRQIQKTRIDNNLDLVKAQNRIRNARYRRNNRDKVKESNNRYFLKNKEQIYVKVRKYSHDNPALILAKVREYQARRIKAQPAWVDRNRLKEIYARSRRLQHCLNIELHVDHIVPLRSKFVCGLHVPWNLQIISKKANLRKHNTTWPDMTDWRN